MTRDEALAEIDKLFKMPPARHRVWDKIKADERMVINALAGYSRGSPILADQMTREQMDRCWLVIERFARLAYQVAMANDAQPAKDDARLVEVSKYLQGAA